jgi:hypothetical protein
MMTREFVVLLVIALIGTCAAMCQETSRPSGPTEATVAALKAYFSAPDSERGGLARPWEQATGLSAADAAAWREAIWRAYLAADGPLQRAWRDNIAQQRVTLGRRSMSYSAQVTGEKPVRGWPLVIALHPGEDGAEARDERYPLDGMYVRPREGADNTSLWDSPEGYELLELLVRQFVAFGDVDPNRVCLQGFAEGGEAVLRLGPNMADRWAALAVADAAGSVDRTPVENLCHTPVNLQVSRRDDERARFQLASAWADTMQKLRDDGNPDEYICEFVARAEARGATDDRSSLTWLDQFARNPVPKRIVWTQSGPVQRDRYWLRLDDPYRGKEPGNWSNRPETIDARVGGQLVTLAVKGLSQVTLRLDDRLLDLDRTVTITVNDEEAFTGRVPRSAVTLVKTLVQRGDTEMMFCAELPLPVPPAVRSAGEVGTVRCSYPAPPDPQLAAAVDAALHKAGANADELCRALADVGDQCRPGMVFLIANMPDRDLVGLKAAFLVEDVQLAYQAWRQAPWSAEMSESQFFQYILPYAHFNERRDNWRRDFYERFHERAWTFRDPIDATKWLNDTLNDTVNVHYHAFKRPKSDQSPYESIAASYASCTGLSVLLADACRAVGIPARLAGVARWTKTPGNHTWVEVWGGPNAPDGAPAIRRWYNIGDTGSDPRGNDWVKERCREETDVDQPLSRVYAACYRRGEMHFPLAWDLELKYVPALNVTRFYTSPNEVALPLPAGRHDVAVWWADEVVLTATGDGPLRLPLARGEPFRVVITGPDGSREERRLEP